MNRNISVIIIIFTASIFGCSRHPVTCSDASIKDALTRGSIENYSEEIRSQIDVAIPIIEENKNEKGNFIKSCSATAEVRFKADVMEKFTSLSGSISKYKNFTLTNSPIKTTDKIEIKYSIRKNEADGGYYINGEYTSKSGFYMSKKVPAWANDSQKLITAAKYLDQLRAFNETIAQDSRTGSELKKLAHANDLDFDFCEEIYTGRSFDLVCRISNPAGFVDVISSNKLSDASVELMKFIEAISLFGGQSQKISGKKVTDPEKIIEYMNDKISFNPKSDPNESGACKIASIICD